MKQINYFKALLYIPVLILTGCGANMPITRGVLYPFQHYGYIIDNSNRKIEGLIELDAWGNWWRNQATIGFCPQSEIDVALANGKTTIKSRWYKSDKLAGYGFDNKKFVTLPIELKTELGVSTKKRMLEVLSEANRTYKFYESAAGVTDINRYSVCKMDNQGKLVWIK